MAPRIPYSPRAGIKNPAPRMSDREVSWNDIKKSVKALKWCRKSRQKIL